MAIANKFTKVENVNISEIEMNPSWNARLIFGEDEKGTEKEDDGEGGFEGLMQSIAAKGQDTPVLLRLQKDKKKPYFLVTGFRRFSAITKLGLPTIRAEIREMTDTEAREANVRENTARDSLSGPDLCFGIGKIVDGNKGITSVALSNLLGMNQSYVNTMMGIWANVDQGIIKAWRAAPGIKLPVKTMGELAKLPKADQQAKYDELISNQKPAKVGRGSWQETAKKQATAMGTMLGNLTREGFLQLGTTQAEFFGDVDALRMLISFKKEATEEQVASIAHAAESAFSEALKVVPPDATVKDDPKGKGKGKNGTVAQAS